LEIKTFPASLIINIDYSNQLGSHWIGLNLTTTTVEIYDSIGFSRTLKLFKPVLILKFLKKYGSDRHYLTSPPLQSDVSNLCGFYCIYFILVSTYLSFRDSLSIFSANLTDNDRILIHVLKHI